ncbi:MAG: efflux RND transporter periplasmic adaptor subunit [Candidatus Marinimicrobia bacterium]|nr:efflux RND transporter periplasmic adaptor subunit [Candidatus Neomarinimicrobiota bacterium]
MSKKIIYGVAGLLLLFLLWRIVNLFLAADEKQSARGGQPAVAVEVDSVYTGHLIQNRQLTGTILPQYKYVISPKVSGRIIEISKRIGDWVKEGELIARIDDAEYRQSVIEAEANLKISQAGLAEAATNYKLVGQELERVRSLQAKGISSTAELDAALSNFTAQKSRFELAEAQVDQRKSALKSAQIRLSYSVLRASKPGYIGERFVDEGALLAPNAAVVSILGMDSVIVSTSIIERDYGSIRVGQPAEIKIDAYEQNHFFGSVARIAPMLQETSRVAQMEVEVANDSLLLKPGMFARVIVRVAEKNQAQYVDSRALVRKTGTLGVFVVDTTEQVARFVPVTTGISSNEYTEVVSPILHGMVVTLGQHLLDDGSPVIISLSMGSKMDDQL